MVKEQPKNQIPFQRCQANIAGFVQKQCVCKDYFFVIVFSFLQSAGAAAFGSVLWDMGGTLLRRELLPI